MQFARIFPTLMAIVIHGPVIIRGELLPFQCHDLDKAQGLCARFPPDGDSAPIAVTRPGVEGIRFTCDHLATNVQATIVNECCLTLYQIGNSHSGQFVPINSTTFASTCVPP
ncbi:hypothetical protein MJO28_016460 [Puccinia striiformis f. sp. tritici]|uniref:Uncharacterized protein n=1 Tax=Puccinia striiformis f. sp. tritici TaxID=168172 RepID=A0ACC0DPV4_9BASI|nr:hypothetical protein MJO28_016460 [Puccinia striiformis f. sp. tritici]